MPPEEPAARTKPSSHLKTVSAEKKAAVVLRVLRGEGAGAVADEIGVSVDRLERWQATFTSGGLEALKKRSAHHKTLGQKLAARTKMVRPWVGLLIALVVTIFLLVRFLNRDAGQ